MLLVEPAGTGLFSCSFCKEDEELESDFTSTTEEPIVGAVHADKGRNFGSSDVSSECLSRGG